MSGANGLGSIYCSHHICSADPALFSHLASPDDHSYPSSSLGHTSIKAAGHSISLAGGTLKEGCRPVDEGTSLAGLCLGPPTVPELGAHHQKALGWGLWGHQPRTESGGDDRQGSGPHHQAQSQTPAGSSLQCPTIYNTSQSRKGRLGERWACCANCSSCSLAPSQPLSSLSEHPGATHRKNVWCSMQTFQSRLAERWLGSLKPMVLSNCSYWEAKKRGLEVRPGPYWPPAQPTYSLSPHTAITLACSCM